MDPAFTLRVKPYRKGAHNLCERCKHSNMIVIVAYDDGVTMGRFNHNRIDVEVRHAGEVIFPRGQLYCGTNQWTSTDGIEARELVLSLVAMKPGDTDEDYFVGYTAAQLEWAIAHGDALDMERETRYCDENGNPKRSKH